MSMLAFAGTASATPAAAVMAPSRCATLSTATAAPWQANGGCVRKCQPGHWSWEWRNHRRVHVWHPGPCLIHCSPNRR
jgi:hypothetical protein